MVDVVKQCNINMWENIFRATIASQTTSLYAILVGLHNALTHGDILVEAGIDEVKNSELEDFFSKLDVLKSCDLVKTHKT